jgi:hypothetical protein
MSMPVRAYEQCKEVQSQTYHTLKTVLKEIMKKNHLHGDK